jgi:hypothetical protein
VERVRQFHQRRIAAAGQSIFHHRFPAVASAYSKTFGDLGSPGHSASHTPSVTSSPTKAKIGNIPVTIFFSTQVGEIETLETGIQSRLKNAKKIRVIAMLIGDKGILASLLALAEANDENMLIFESAALAGAYDNYFNALFAQYQKHGAKLPPV